MKKAIVVIGLLLSQSVFSTPLSESFWHDVPDLNTNNGVVNSANGAPVLRSKALLNHQKHTLKQRSLMLDEQYFREFLAATALSETDERLQGKSQVLKNKKNREQGRISLPLPNGENIDLYLFDSPVLAPEIAEQYPDIKTWRVQGVDKPDISGRLDFTSEGFHGMLNMPDGDTVFIDPDVKNHSGLYHSLSKRDNRWRFKTDFNCGVDEKHSLLDHFKNKISTAKKLSQIPAPDLITYRLAIAGTAEYTDSQGGTPTTAYDSMVTTINRVNQIYQRDIGIKLEIVSGNDFFYTNAATDPYTNNNAGSLISQNINNLNNHFGAANYDIGHVFAQGPLGGLAYVGATCIDAYKGGGATGIPDPQGEIFAIEFVAHEMGHQLGASHSFNSEKRGCGGGNRSALSAVEPGSGSTIMSYSGLCDTDNIQYNSDAMFHWLSIEQINHYTRVEGGSSCGSKSSSGHQNPRANAGADAVIPLNTPFLLEGTATAGVSYTWDQVDVGSASKVDVDTGDNAIIRTFLPSSSKQRYIPKLSDLFAGTHSIGEILPQTVRELNFAFVVRDNQGGIDADLKTISVKDNGRMFRVLSQSGNETFTTGTSVDIVWSVAGTSAAPFNCSRVDIGLIRENGTRNMLLENTENDGRQQLVIPADTPTMSNARILLACHNQPFFQISKGSIRVKKGANIDTTPPVITLNGSSVVVIEQGSTYTDAGATAQDDTDGTLDVVTTGSVNTSIVGTYHITYTATDAAGNSASKTRTVNVVARADTTPPVITLNGSSVVVIEQGSTYTDAGATAQDDTDGSVDVVATGSVNTSVAGTYRITYTATDAAGNTARSVRIIRVTSIADTSAPVITLNGASYIKITKGTSYVDAGASATDNVDAVVSVITTGTVNTNVVGIYTLTYTATDAAGNKSTKTRTVEVIASTPADTSAPVLTLQGSSIITLIVGQTYVEPGYSAIDAHDGAVSVRVSGSVDSSQVGSYTIHYSATDAAGNSSYKTRIVRVIAAAPDTRAPVITLLGDSVITLTEGESYIEPGYSATDNRDGNVTVRVSGSVDTSRAGTYVLTYTSQDAAGNSSKVNRIIIVNKKNDSGQPKEDSSKGGSMGFLLLCIGVLGLRRFRK